MYCSKCSSQIPDGSAFCPECGQKLTASQPTQQQPQFVQQQAQFGQQPYQQQVPLRQQTPYVQTPYPQTPSQPAAGDPLTAPLTVGNFFWMPFIIAIPIVGIIMLFVWAFSKDTNINRKNYARSILIWGIISIVLSIIMAVVGGGIFASIRDTIASSL